MDNSGGDYGAYNHAQQHPEYCKQQAHFLYVSFQSTLLLQRVANQKHCRCLLSKAWQSDGMEYLFGAAVPANGRGGFFALLQRLLHQGHEFAGIKILVAGTQECSCALFR